MQTLHTRLDLDTLNAMDLQAFVATVGPTFEHSPWVAEGAWAARPFAGIDALHAAMMEVVRRAPRARQIAFLRAHPELAGREAQARTMTAESTSEQSSAGLDALTREELDEMRRLNREYRDRHGFPFIIAVRRHSKQQIFDALCRRARLDTDAELAEAMAQIGLITKLRVAALFAA